MSYAPSTDFLALLRQTAAGVVLARVPGLDTTLTALARAGMFRLWVGQTAPTANQATTAWLKPALPSWTAEGVLWLWNGAAYVTATPALWFTLLSAGEGSIFDAIAPTTTTGDMIVRGPTTNVRLPIGPLGSSLTSDGTMPEWVSPSVLSFDTRTLAIAATIPGSVNLVSTLGYATAGDGGGGLYKRGISSGLGAWQDAGSNWWNLTFNGTINLRSLGAGFGSGAADVAAMTAAIGLGSGGLGAVILIPAGTTLDLSTGSFLITKSGTRILGADNQTSSITFNPAGPATLFTFYKAGDANGVSNSEVSNLRIAASSNAVNKVIFALKNTTFFNLYRVNLQNITDTGGQSIGILNMGRNWLTVTECIINADKVHVIALNPERAIAGFEDADFLTFERCQLAALNAASAIHEVQTGCNVTNWSNTDCDWALGRYGVLNTDSTAIATSNDWTFTRCRREQEQGANPTMFAILRTGGVPVLRNLDLKDCATGNQLYNLAGIDRFHHENTSIFFAGVSVGTADATVLGIDWIDLFCDPTCTISHTGQTLIEGRYRQGGTNAAPIYRNAEYSNATDAGIAWVGAPSANGRRMGIWRKTADVPVYNGSNAFALLPWSLYTVQYAEIRVSSNATSGIATFVIGQAAPAGCSILAGQTNFAVDAGAGHLSVFHFSDTIVGIVNKLAGSVPVTIEVVFTI